MKLDSSDFELMNLPVRFEQDLGMLERRRRELQGAVHPDRHAGDDAAARRVAMQWAVRVNEAYVRLRDPLKRAAYLCELHGVKVDADDNTAMPASFLMQQMEWREALDDARDAAAIGDVAREVVAQRDAAFVRLARTLDDDHDHVDAGRQVRALMFLERLAADVERRLGRVERLTPVALLQISEPGANPDPHQRRLAVGIDLGTTHSLVAAVRHGVAECLPDSEGRVLLPSVVRYLAGGGRRIGHAALADSGIDPTNTIASVKRLMGRGLSDIAPSTRSSYDFVEEPGMVRLTTVAGAKSPIEVSAEILATLRQRAEDTLGDDLFGAVITVPAYFDDAQRQATKDAARLAGLQVLRLLSEPTAAAVAYGLDNASEGLFAVYDLGGGTFDVSILRLTLGVFEVIATGGDSALGGDDFDAAIAGWALAQSGLGAGSASDRRTLLIAARAAKEALSAADDALLACMLDGAQLALRITRREFDALATPLVNRTMKATRQALRDAGIDRGALDGVILVGGATRMPIVRAAVADAFGRAPLTNLDPDQVVALGAAIQADALAGNAGASQVLLLDVIPLSLGLETMGGLVERIIPRNSAIPTARAQDFTTYMDGQTAIAIHVVQGERELVADCRSLARFELRGIPPMVAGAARVRVSFEVDADGLLHVSAREQTSNVEASINVKPSYGLADDDISRMLTESFGTAEADMRTRASREAKVDADRLVLATRSAMLADGDLLEPAERAAIEAGLVELETLISKDGDGGHDAIVRATEQLAAATENFAAERMNRGIRRALAGRRLEDV